MFLRQRFYVCALSETKLKGKGEVSSVEGGGGPVTEWVVVEVCDGI